MTFDNITVTYPDVIIFDNEVKVTSVVEIVQGLGEHPPTLLW
jgi:hypothetical protein